MTKIKICGITTLEDALASIEAGADALGFVFHPASPRHIFPEQAAAIISRIPPFIQTVGLFVDEPAMAVNDIAAACRLDIVQLHGDEPPDYCATISRRIIKAFRVKDITSLDAMKGFDVSACLLDAWSPSAHGGTGRTFNWEIAEQAVQTGRRIVLAGGLTPDNVAEAIRRVRPYAVDVSSGVEAAPGRKDYQLVEAFCRAVRGADED